MIDKFQKLFGPNPPRAPLSGPQEVDFGVTPEDDAHLRQIARIKNKRRILGLMVLVMAVAVVAPSFFEPNDYYADRGAKLEIPALQDEKPSKVVSLAPEKAKPLKNVPVMPQEPSSAASLSAANKVAEGVKPAPDEPSKVVKKSSDSAKRPAEGKSKAEKNTTSLTQSTQTITNTRSSSESAKHAKPSNKTSEAAPLRAVANGRYFIQVIATSNKNSAQKQAQKLRALGLPAYTEIVHRRGTDLWRVRVGRFASEQEARRALDILAFNAIENGGVNQEPAKKN